MPGAPVVVPKAFVLAALVLLEAVVNVENCSQFLPANDCVQKHVNELPFEKHRPPLRHGFGLQEFAAA